MSAALIDKVKQQAATEAARRAHPEGFPALPGVPAARYCDADFARLEHDTVFSHSWLMVAHLDELANPGDYRRVDQLPEPIVLVRGTGDEVRAFYNTCQHRGAELVTEASGNAGRRLTCPYHSWVYDLDGALVGLPETHNFPEGDRECLALRSVRCETWGPLVFVNLDNAAPPLAEYLDPVNRDLSELGALADRLHLVSHPAIDVDVNWKLPVDANIETYHVNTVHRDSAARLLDQAATAIQLLRNGHSRMLIATRDGRSMGDVMPFAPLFDGVGDLPDAGTFSYHVFPNLSIVFSGRGFVFFITNWPIAPNRSSYHVHFCSSLAPATEDSAKLNDAFAEINRAVLLEDLSVLPGMQRSIDAGGIDVVRLGYQERRIYHLHETIDHYMGERTPAHLRVPAVLADHIES
ncbi:MAG TPA: aromatic ring-hydroxylating dioxygenase subunit alpha [Acidimicrobiales bacterium]|nr:aromatic ring-hydroxylating dioxygenase subunit alpha [Acidimicrobiales bacterium]